ncbi:MAG: bacillithiol biosynthesis cysteine-adding enzyme BshC [Bacteroidetes bacterium]|nr:bacillithiol biosynthesis cysteine-adding enzyme BshC [Bacteroidota bacterium]
MFDVKTNFLNDTGVLNNLVKDYIDRNKKLDHFYDYYPDQKGFEGILKNNNYASLDRKKLTEILLEQASTVENSSQKSKNNIELLLNQNSYTVTTGHQLCLFTGPLYFIYKLFSAINLAEELKTLFPDKNFIPVYWEASEDHDFEEINHFNLFGKTLKWETDQQGAVGNFETQDLQSLLPLIKEIFGNTANALYLEQLFEKAYLQHSSLSSATRYLVNELFGAYGLVIVNGNDARFKKQFITHFKTDIFDNLAFKKVTEQIEELKALGYGAQVNPREINCFYMERGLRGRLEKQNENYNVIGTDRIFTNEEINSVVDNEPEKISPNVVLRPLYQQAILPNIAYVGGPGELAYWLQYKSMFSAFGITFPVLVPRAFITLVEKNVKNKIDKLDFNLEDVFKDEEILIKIFQVRSNNIFDLGMEKETLEKLYASISEKIAHIDKTLVNTVSAELQKTLNGMDVVSGKANRSLKQRSETEINQVKFIKDKLFPGKIPQERFDNFSAFYIKWGPEFFKILKDNIRPLSLLHTSLVEN